MQRLTLNIDGMTCGHCVSMVMKALKAQDGVVIEQVKIGQATVTFDPARANAQAIVDAIADEGYVAAAA
ncbi:MAG: cation transporter [Gemmatimonadaceae bacterium]